MESNQGDRLVLGAASGRTAACDARGPSAPSALPPSGADGQPLSAGVFSVSPFGFSGSYPEHVMPGFSSVDQSGRTTRGGGVTFATSSAPSCSSAAQGVSVCSSDMPRRHRASIKSVRPSVPTTHQLSRHSALLRIRRSDRDKAVASRRRQFMPVNAPPFPQPIAPLLRQLIGLLPLAPLAPVGEVEVEPTPAHQEALRVLKLVHELIACYPDLVEGGASFPGHPQATRAPVSNHSADGAGGPEFSDATVVTAACQNLSTPVLLLVQPTCAIASVAVEGAVSPFASLALRQFSLRLLQHACGCIAAAVATQPLPEETVQVWLPLLLSLLQTILTKSPVAAEQSEAKGTIVALARQVKQEVLYALGNIAADFQDAVCQLGGVSAAVHAMREALVELDVSSAAQLSISASSSYPSACSSATCLRTAAWFLANLLRPPLHMSAVLKPMLAGTGVSLDVFDGAFENEASMCVSTPASSRPLVGGLQVLTELLRLEVEKQHAALRSPATDDRRAAIGEGLWCLLLFLESVFCAHQYLPPPCSSGQPVGTGATCSLPGSAGGNSDGSMMAGNGSAPNNAQGNPPDQRGAVHLQSCPGGGGELQRTGDREFGATGAAGDTTALVLTAVQAEEASVKALRDTSPDLVSLFVRLIFEGFQGVLLRREREATLGRGEGSLSSQIGGCAHLGIVGAPMSAEVPVPSTSAAAAGLAAARDFVGSGSESGGLSEQRSSERGGEGIDATTSDLQIDGERERLERFNGNGADILVPALKLLNLFCACPRLADAWADEVISTGGEEFQRLLLRLLEQKDVVHRGVLCATLSFTASMAAGASQRTDYVAALIKPAAEILSSVEPYDIRREAAVYLLHMAMNHERRHLDKVLGVEPSVIQGMLDNLEQNKYDRPSVMIALDFLHGVLDARPSIRIEVYKRDGIGKIESAQFLHDPGVDDLISWMVSHYFDDFNEAEEDDEEAVERAAAQDLHLAGQLNSVLDFSS